MSKQIEEAVARLVVGSALRIPRCGLAERMPCNCFWSVEYLVTCEAKPPTERRVLAVEKVLIIKELSDERATR